MKPSFPACFFASGKVGRTISRGACWLWMAGLCWAWGQISPVPPSSGASDDLKGTLSSASSYKLEWHRHYELQTDLSPGGTPGENGTLWLITRAGPGKPENFLTKIEPDGRLAGRFNLTLPLREIEWINYLSLASSGHSVGLLASLASGGQDQTFEGAYFIPVLSEGLGIAKRIARRGPQFPTLAGIGNDQFLAAGDQQPLTLLKLASDGALLWRRAFSRNLALPTIAAGPSGNLFVLSQGGAYLTLQMFAPSGTLLRSRRIAARQGTVVANDDGGCSILFTRKSNGADNVVYLAKLDQTLAELNRTETPLRGWGGRTYHFISTRRGYLTIGEAPAPRQQIAAEFDASGKVIWQQAVEATFTPMIVPLKTGFYFVRDTGEGNGMDVEKYSY